jgi:hypothetical protein
MSGNTLNVVLRRLDSTMDGRRARDFRVSANMLLNARV